MKSDKMIRKQVCLESKQNDEIKLLSARQGKTEAEVIREAVDHYMTQENDALLDPLEQLIGIIDEEHSDGASAHDRDIYLAENDKK